MGQRAGVLLLAPAPLPAGAAPLPRPPGGRPQALRRCGPADGEGLAEGGDGWLLQQRPAGRAAPSADAWLGGPFYRALCRIETQKEIILSTNMPK